MELYCYFRRNKSFQNARSCTLRHLSEAWPNSFSATPAWIYLVHLDLILSIKSTQECLLGLLQPFIFVSAHTVLPKPWQEAITLRDAGELLWIKITCYLMVDTGCSHRSWLQIANNFYAKIYSPPDEIHLNLQFLAKITWHPFLVVISAFMALLQN